MKKKNKSTGFEKTKLETKILILAAFSILSYVVYSYFSINSIREVEVNGPIYEQVINGKDLLADILPPPMYIVESYLDAYLMLDHTGTELEEIIAKGEVLESEFNDRVDHWQNTLSDSDETEIAMKESITKIHELGEEFYQVRNEEFIPLVQAGEIEAADAVLTEQLDPLYTELREDVLVLADQATEFSTLYEGIATKTTKSREAIMIAGGIVISASLILIALLILRSINGSVRRIVEVLQDIAEGEGDLTKRIDVSSKDELGKLAKWFNQFVDKLDATIYTVKSTSDAFASSIENMNESSLQLSHSSDDQTQMTTEVSSTVEEFTQTLTHITNNVRKQNEIVQSSTVAMEELSAGIHSVVSNTENMKKKSIENVNAAQEGKEKVQSSIDKTIEMNQKVFEIARKIDNIETEFQNIVGILRVIEDITEQTNLLAMNASIEAAHAGEAGAGFAIVASEIRSLSENTAHSVQKIKTIIKNMNERVNEAVEISDSSSALSQEVGQTAQEAGSALENIIENIRSITQMVEEISAITAQQGGATSQVLSSMEELRLASESTSSALEQQTEASAQILSAITAVNQGTEENSRLSENLKSLAGNLSSETGELISIVGQFKLTENEQTWVPET